MGSPYVPRKSHNSGTQPDASHIDISGLCIRYSAVAFRAAAPPQANLQRAYC
jgi:hypothetical protein